MGTRVTLRVNLLLTSTVNGVNRRIATLIVALVPIIVFGVLATTVTVPYVALGPGPTFNTLGKVDGKEVVVEGAGWSIGGKAGPPFLMALIWSIAWAGVPWPRASQA